MSVKGAARIIPIDAAAAPNKPKAGVRADPSALASILAAAALAASASAISFSSCALRACVALNVDRKADNPITGTTRRGAALILCQTTPFIIHYILY